MSIKSVSNSTPDPTSPTRWERAETMFIRAFTRSCYNSCVADLPKDCQKEFGSDGYKNPSEKCKEVWLQCMRPCVRQALGDL